MAHVHREWPTLTVRANLVEGVPSEVLVHASADADVTVLGGRHLGAVTGLLLGSVSSAVAARAEGPVVVVRGSGRVPVERPAVVAGLDGSPVTEDVLAFAFDHAARHGRVLELAVCAVDPFEHRLTGAAGARLTDAAQCWLRDTVAPWRAKFPRVDVRETVLVAHPVAGLVQASVGQELLVVGNGAGDRRRSKALLGSVTQGVLHHADCPVAVIPYRFDVDG
jgi:nucleotide-binding universal stress UspA family protein